MAIDTTVVRSRRSLLMATVTALMGAAAATVAGAQRVLAAGDDGKVIHVGDSLVEVRSMTVLHKTTNTDAALHVSCVNGSGLEGYSGTGWGVLGYSSHFVGVNGYGPEVTGVRGLGKIGVEGTSSASWFWGVGGYNQAAHGYGVWGEANHATGVGIGGASTHGRGAVLRGGKAQLRLAPSSDSTHPASGSAGDLFVDASHRLWFCKTGGNPAVWKQVSLV